MTLFIANDARDVARMRMRTSFDEKKSRSRDPRTRSCDV